eukprot:361569-Chlamydomonas_euryale.AAC.5
MPDVFGKINPQKIETSKEYPSNRGSGVDLNAVSQTQDLADWLGDLADWLGVGPAGLFNFKPSVRPVPLECHIQGYPGALHICGDLTLHTCAVWKRAHQGRAPRAHTKGAAARLLLHACCVDLRGRQGG